MFDRFLNTHWISDKNLISKSTTVMEDRAIVLCWTRQIARPPLDAKEF